MRLPWRKNHARTLADTPEETFPEGDLDEATYRTWEELIRDVRETAAEALRVAHRIEVRLSRHIQAHAGVETMVGGQDGEATRQHGIRMEAGADPDYQRFLEFRAGRARRR